ncbi:BrnT family toxin [Mesorhizobium onobrychidis]|uniref:BrnT family toxin n=1 Tax=Mesorhizobium onobrychidis TaxID=2775404 RepID=UPI0021572F64|nr:BrnT family toxin [Mesorhizobium onobrychidis]
MRFLYIQKYQQGLTAVRFEWDDEKARKNKAKHGVSFEFAEIFDFDSAMIFEDATEDYGEERFVGIGFIGNKIHQIAYTPRNGNIRVISLRRATKEEIRSYVEYIETGY